MKYFIPGKEIFQFLCLSFLFTAFFVSPTIQVNKVSTTESEIRCYMHARVKSIIPAGKFATRAKPVRLYSIVA